MVPQEFFSREAFRNASKKDPFNHENDVIRTGFFIRDPDKTSNMTSRSCLNVQSRSFGAQGSEAIFHQPTTKKRGERRCEADPNTQQMEREDRDTGKKSEGERIIIIIIITRQRRKKDHPTPYRGSRKSSPYLVVVFSP